MFAVFTSLSKGDKCWPKERNWKGDPGVTCLTLDMTKADGADGTDWITENDRSSKTREIGPFEMKNVGSFLHLF